MAYVTPIYGGSPAQIDYRLGVEHGCPDAARTDPDGHQVDYRVDARERPLVWIGEGLVEFGIAAGDELTPAQFDQARALIAGCDPRTGEQLVAAKVAVPDDAKLPLVPLVTAIQAAAVKRGVQPTELFTSATLAKAYARAERAVTRLGEAARLRSDEALDLVAGANVSRPWSKRDTATAVANLTETIPMQDPVTGEASSVTRPRRVPVGIQGYDINIGLPKSYSLLLAFADERIAEQVEQIYREATNRVFAWTEAHASYVMRGKHGDGHTAATMPSTGLAGWVMVHRSARPVGDRPIGDPHWHVHMTIANLAKGADGNWSTIAAGGRDLMRHAAAIDKLTQAEVRAVLSRELGIIFARSARTGLWEIEHIPDETIQHFSKRHAQVETVLAELGYSSTGASAAMQRVVTRESRSHKTEHTALPDADLRAYWQADARDAGHDPAQMIAHALDDSSTITDSGSHGVTDLQTDRVRESAVHDTNEPHLAAATIAVELADPDTGLTAHGRRFSRLDALCRVADALPAGATIADVETMTDLVLAEPVFQPLTSHRDTLAAGGDRHLSAGHMAHAGLYTTVDVPQIERQILAAAEASQHWSGDGVQVDERTIELAADVVEAQQGYPLSIEQRQVLAVITGSGRPLDSIEGPPGTGKTTLMRAARVAWEARGYTVAGAATAAVAAQNLAAEAGISSATVAQWLRRIDTGQGLTGVDVLVLDEANLTNDRDRARLYAGAADAGTKIVEVGDPRQLRGVGVGSMFGHLHRLLGGPTLTYNRRQRDEDERTAIAAWRSGRHVDALRSWADRGRLIATDTSHQALAAMIAAWKHARAGAPDPHTQIRGLIMLAATNAHVERINQAVQAVRVADGELGPSAIYTLPAGRTLTVHVGDQVLLRTNDRRGLAITGDAVLNGYRGIITHLDQDHGPTVAWQDEDGADHQARLSPAYVAGGGLELGYALTAHKAEGLTVGAEWARPDGSHHGGHVLVYAPGLDNPGLYVAASRHRDQVLLFGAREDLEGDREQALLGAPRTQDELTARVIARLAEHATTTAESANDRPVIADLPDHAVTDSGTHRVRESAGHKAANAAPGSPGDVDEPSAVASSMPSWRDRSHGRLSDRQLDIAIAAARRALADHDTKLSEARTRLAVLTQDITAGRGPAQAALVEQAAHLANRAARADEVEQLDASLAGLHTAQQQTWQAMRDTHQALETNPWYRPGRRAELEKRRDGLRAEITHLDHGIAHVRRRLGTDDHYMARSELAQTRIDHRHLVATYPDQQQQAQRRDEKTLADLRDRLTKAAGRRADTTQRLDELDEEKTIRADLPVLDATSEKIQRAAYLIRQAREQREQAGTQRSAAQRDADNHHRRAPTTGPRHDGPGLAR